MSIRNGLLLLIPLADYFPFEAKTGQTLLAVVKTLSLRENSDGGREDLKILTRGSVGLPSQTLCHSDTHYSYEAILSKKSRAWETTAPTPRLPMPLATAPESPAVITPAQPSSTSVSPEGQPQTDKTAKPFIVKEGERPRDALPEQLEKATSEPPSVDAGDQVENDPSVDPSTHADDMPLRTGSAQASLSRAGQKADTSISGKCDDSLVQPSMPVDPQSDISGAASHVRHRLPQRPPVSLASSDTRPGTPDTERPRLSRNSSTATAPAPKSPARHHSGLPPKPSIGTQRRRDGDWGRPDDRTAPNDNERASEQEFFSNRGGLRRRESDRDGGAISNRHPDDGSVDDRSRNIHREALMEPPPMPVKAPAETGITRMSASRNGSPDSATSRSTDRERNPSSRDMDREKERERRARKANERDGDPRESRASRSSRDSRYRERDENRDRKEHRDRDRDGREVDSSKRRRVDDTDNKPPLAHSVSITCLLFCNQRLTVWLDSARMQTIKPRSRCPLLGLGESAESIRAGKGCQILHQPLRVGLMILKRYSPHHLEGQELLIQNGPKHQSLFVDLQTSLEGHWLPVLFRKHRNRMIERIVTESESGNEAETKTETTGVRNASMKASTGPQKTVVQAI